jgi:hypothetical protein
MKGAGVAKLNYIDVFLDEINLLLSNPGHEIISRIYVTAYFYFKVLKSGTIPGFKEQIENPAPVRFRIIN